MSNLPCIFAVLPVYGHALCASMYVYAISSNEFLSCGLQEELLSRVNELQQAKRLKPAMLLDDVEDVLQQLSQMIFEVGVVP